LCADALTLTTLNPCVIGCRESRHTFLSSRNPCRLRGCCGIRHRRGQSEGRRCGPAWRDRRSCQRSATAKLDSPL